MFPFFSVADRLEPDDLELFAHDFSEIILSLFPFAAGPVSFQAFRSEAVESGQPAPGTGPCDRCLEQLKKTRQPVVAASESMLYLPIAQDTKLVGAAVLAGMDGDLLKRMSAGWLADRSQIISREFSLIKRQAMDPATGLLNIHHLRQELDCLLKAAASFTLVLVEAWPRAGNSIKGLRQIGEAGSYIGSLLGHLPLHHLGCGVFAHIWPDTSEQQAQKLAKTMLDLMKRESFGQVHLGMTAVAGEQAASGSDSLPAGPGAEAILARAWQALRIACRRGPYALCPFSSISNHDRHPLRRPPVPIMRDLQAAWRRREGLALVLLRPYQDPLPDAAFVSTVLPLLTAQARPFAVNGQEVYTLLDSQDKEKALAWTRALQQKIKAASGSSSLAGIAVFPEHGFKKADLPANAAKALLHTRFYGPDTATVFDAVSLNISGDIYYNEGDLNRAVREYRLGLTIAPDNINLLNSLGEAHGRMNRHQKAVGFFRRALQLDAANYMALFNLGVTYLVMKDEARAIQYLEQALALKQTPPRAAPTKPGSDETKADYDLYFHLGRLYCQSGRFEEAIGLLTRCLALNNGQDLTGSGNRQRVRRNSSYRYLGVAYQHTGNLREAIAMLQRAVRFNPRDAASLSLLGELYLLEGQGDQIALSLCSQALNLDDTRWEHWYSLALVSSRLGQLEQARSLLAQALRRQRQSIPAIRLLAQLQAEAGQSKEAMAMVKKLLRLAPADQPARAMLAKLRKNNRRFSSERMQKTKEPGNV